MERIPAKFKFSAFWAVVSAFYALMFVGMEFAGSPLAGWRGAASLAGQWLVVSAAASVVIGLLAVNRWVWAVTAPLLMVCSAAVGYYKLTMGLSLTPVLIELALTNDFNTWASVITFKLVGAVLLALAVGAALAWVRFVHVRSPRPQALWACGFLVAVLLPVTVIKRFKAPVSARVPYSFWYAVEGYLLNREAVSELRDTYEATDAVAPENAPMVVLVIGESLRPDHLQLNGYHRPTTPRLARDSGVVSFPNVTTDFVYTHLSVPRIMTRAHGENPDAAFTEQSFITLFNKAGFRTAWLSNQDAVNTYAYFMHEADTLVQCNGARTFYAYEKWLDSDLLEPFGKALEKATGRGLIVMHTIGSHWWYRSHYPDSLAKFQPETDSRVVSELTREQMVNSYDNTILATDSFLADVTDMLRGRNAVVIFISDHGEALGEDGKYLHAEDNPQLHPTACLVWYSPEFAALYPQKVSALKKNRAKAYTTDAIFHTVLHAGDVDTPVLELKNSMFHDSDRNE